LLKQENWWHCVESLTFRRRQSGASMNDHVWRGRNN
jgi:hypothetical protein